jgi:mRNA-degrading endonuclease toxin of MazEF toxin-antitoxin module
MGAPGGASYLLRGDVVTVPFPFSDLSGSKLRPALVVAALPGSSDIILCQITSQPQATRPTVAITSADFVLGSLLRDSFVRPDRLFTAASGLTRRVGRLNGAKTQEVIDQIILLFTT